MGTGVGLGEKGEGIQYTLAVIKSHGDGTHRIEHRVSNIVYYA